MRKRTRVKKSLVVVIIVLVLILLLGGLFILNKNHKIEPRKDKNIMIKLYLEIVIFIILKML